MLGMSHFSSAKVNVTAMKLKNCLLLLIVLLAVTFTIAEEKCDIPNIQISKMSRILHHPNETVYSDDLYESKNKECARLINNIHMQLRRLTQRYKLMHKGYVDDEEQGKVMKAYEGQLKKLIKVFEDLKKITNTQGSVELAKLEQKINELLTDASKLQPKQQT
uniref:Putative 62 kDa family member n=1 Tax=Psorophora albipes TaxID=869069 RepID=T1E2I4_9DIPT